MDIFLLTILYCFVPILILYTDECSYFHPDDVSDGGTNGKS